MKRFLLGCAFVMCLGLGINAEATPFTICFTTTNLIDRVQLTIEPFNDTGDERTLYRINGVWYGFSLYEILITGTGVYTTEDWWLHSSSHGVNTTTFFGGNKDCTFTLKRAVWTIQCSGTAAPFQVSGTFSGVDDFDGCGDHFPWGHAPLTGIDSTTAQGQQRSLVAEPTSPHGAAGDASMNERR